MKRLYSTEDRPDYGCHFKSLLDNLHDEGRYRIFAELERSVGRYPEVTWHVRGNQSGENSHGTRRTVIVWCSNDYLGMGHNSEVLSAMHAALDSCGAGSGGTRNISGTHRAVVELEDEVADLLDKEAALVFSSGYVANQTALSTLGKVLSHCVIFSDSDNHASMIDGIKASRAEKHIFRHNDLAHLEGLLAEQPVERPKLIAFESVYSMDGDFGKIEEICDLADQYGALTFIDETHGVGLYGHKGGGVAQQLGISDRIDIIQGGLGKGFGVVGGFIAGSEKVIDVVRSYGSGFIFTTSIPPVVAVGAQSSIQHLKRSRSERDKLHQNVKILKEILTGAGLPVLDGPSHILPVMVGNSRLCKKVSDYLLETEAIYIQPINYPTVPRGSERLRITPSPLHTEQHMKELRDALLRAWKSFDVPWTWPITEESNGYESCEKAA